MLKRSKSKETSAPETGSQTQRLNPRAVINETDVSRQLLLANGAAGIQTGNRNANLQAQGSSASKSIFNASFKELKPSKSVDLTTSMSQADGPNSNLAGLPYGGVSYQEDAAETLDLYLFKPSEKVV